jgi:hypothetical protein
VCRALAYKNFIFAEILISNNLDNIIGIINKLLIMNDNDIKKWLEEVFVPTSCFLLDQMITDDAEEAYTVEQLDTIIQEIYRIGESHKRASVKLREYLGIRKYKLNKAFEWTPENMEKFISINQKLNDCWEKLYIEAQSIFKTLNKRVEENDDFLHDFEIEARVNPFIYVPDEDGDMIEVQDCVEEVLIDLVHDDLTINRADFKGGEEYCWYLDREQNWNDTPPFIGKFDEHFIS